MKARVAALAVVACALTHSAPVWADPAGDDALDALDAATHRARSLAFSYEVVLRESGKDERTLALTQKQKGEKSWFEFGAPTDMKGTRVLILSPTQIYVFLPAFGTKVRHITNHPRGQAFMGLAFSPDDLAEVPLGPQYTATLADAGEQTKLVLVPRAGQETPYAKLEILASKDRSLPAELRYFDAAGKSVKTETRTGYTCEGDVCTPGERKMTVSDGSWTRLVAKGRWVNQALSDDELSPRALSR